MLRLQSEAALPKLQLLIMRILVQTALALVALLPHTTALLEFP